MWTMKLAHRVRWIPTLAIVVGCGGQVQTSAIAEAGVKDAGAIEVSITPGPPSSCAAPVAVDFVGEKPIGLDGSAPGFGCVCTRRPGPGESFQCPPGVGESATATIGAAGGVVTLVGRQGMASGVPFRLEIPPTALDHEVTITVTETPVAPLASLTDFSPMYRMEPADLTFAVPVKVMIPASNSTNFVSKALSVYWSGGCGGTFTRLSDSYVNAGFCQGSTKKLGWAVLGHSQDPTLPKCP